MQYLIWILVLVPAVLLMPSCSSNNDAELISSAIKMLGICGVISSIVWGVSIVLGSNNWRKRK